MGSEHFSLKWNNHTNHLVGVFDSLLQSESLVDVTLSCEGESVRAHKLVLSACSPYFKSLFQDHSEQHPIVILKDVKCSEMRSLIQFMYRGEVEVDQNDLDSLFSIAEALMIRGLTGSRPPSGGFTSLPDARGGKSDPSEPPAPSKKRPRCEESPGTSSPTVSAEAEVTARAVGGTHSAKTQDLTHPVSNGDNSPRIKREITEQDEFDAMESGAVAAATSARSGDGGSTAYLCQQCGLSFAKKSLLQLHHNSAHVNGYISSHPPPATTELPEVKSKNKARSPLSSRIVRDASPTALPLAALSGPPLYSPTGWPPLTPITAGIPGRWDGCGRLQSPSPTHQLPLRLPHLLMGARPDQLPSFLSPPLVGLRDRLLTPGMSPLFEHGGLRLQFPPVVSTAAAVVAAASAAASLADYENRSPLNLSTADGPPSGPLTSSSSGGGPTSPSKAISPSCAASSPSTPTPSDDANQFTCKYCTRAFETITALMEHMVVHQGERPFRCDYCGKAFKFRHHLKDHLRIHTGERPFDCKICGKSFARSSILKTHTKIHKQEARQFDMSSPFLVTAPSLVDMSLVELANHPDSPAVVATSDDAGSRDLLPSAPILQEQLLH